VCGQHESGAAVGRPPRGFTVIELIVSLAVLALALAGLGGLARTATRVSRLHEERLDAQQAARRAVERITEELRWAEAVVADPLCVPTGLCAERVTVRIPPGNPYRRDQPYAVTFQHNPRQREVERRVGRGVNNLASLIQAVRFTFLDAQGVPAASPNDVTRILVTLIVTPRTSAAVTIESGVALRNVRVPAPNPTVGPTPSPVWRPTPRPPVIPFPAETPPAPPGAPPMPR
jgi:prepilin-type N-terminal cleavage/methylation domain-containing protein